MMKPLDRVLNCITRKKIDRVPKDFTAYPEIIEQLKQYFSIEGDQSYGSPLIKCIDPRLLEALSCDLRMVAPEYCGPELKREADGTWTNLFGVKRRPITTQHGIYYSYEGMPLKNATFADVNNYPWPKAEWFDYSVIEEQCERFKDYAIVAGYPGNVDFLNKTSPMIGMEELMIGLARKNAIVLTIFDKLAEFFYEYDRRMFESAKGKLHIAYFGDDYGGQDNLLISPRIYEESIYPRFKPFYDLAKSHGLYVMHHSCGSVGKLIPQLLDAGIDILDVVQPYIPYMDLAELKHRYGERLTFHGAICVQQVLPRLSAEEIRDEAERIASILGAGGGYILAPTNKIGPEVPLSTILSLYKEGGQSSTLDTPKT